MHIPTHVEEEVGAPYFGAEGAAEVRVEAKQQVGQQMFMLDNRGPSLGNEASDVTIERACGM